MPDSLGYRAKFGVLIPSTNTSVEPEFADMRPVGVTNHTSRIVIPDIPLKSNEDFDKLIALIDAAQMAAVDSIMSCRPDRLVLGISAETFWNGLKASRALRKLLESHTKLPVSMGADSCEEVLKLFNAKRIGVVTPYWPVGDKNVRRFFEESGFVVAKLVGLQCESPVLIAHVTEERLHDAILEVNGPDIDAIVQVGTNLACARVAAAAEKYLKKPVIAINTAIYWHALRHHGFTEKIGGFGSLLEHH
jgi:maleate isomerase